jgi:hypothetical protein
MSQVVRHAQPVDATSGHEWEGGRADRFGAGLLFWCWYLPASVLGFSGARSAPPSTGDAGCSGIRCTPRPPRWLRGFRFVPLMGRFKMRTRAKLMIGAATMIAAVILAGPAQASTAADDQYGAVLGEQSGGGNVQGAGGLPFTGLNLVLLGGVGAALTAGGVLVRRVARPIESHNP